MAIENNFTVGNKNYQLTSDIYKNMALLGELMGKLEKSRLPNSSLSQELRLPKSGADCDSKPGCEELIRRVSDRYAMRTRLVA